MKKAPILITIIVSVFATAISMSAIAPNGEKGLFERVKELESFHDRLRFGKMEVWIAHKTNARAGHFAASDTEITRDNRGLVKGAKIRKMIGAWIIHNGDLVPGTAINNITSLSVVPNGEFILIECQAKPNLQPTRYEILYMYDPGE